VTRARRQPNVTLSLHDTDGELVAGCVHQNGFAKAAGDSRGGGGKPGGGGTTSGGSITWVMVTDNNQDGLPSFGDTVTFAVQTTATAYPYVTVKCTQNGTVVSQESNAMSAGSLDEKFTLGPTSLWKGGAANCTATLENWDSYSKNDTTTVLASTSFSRRTVEKRRAARADDDSRPSGLHPRLTLRVERAPDAQLVRAAGRDGRLRGIVQCEERNRLAALLEHDRERREPGIRPSAVTSNIPICPMARTGWLMVNKGGAPRPAIR
jgi:hypothetical protein